MDEELLNYIKELIEQERLEGTALGVAMKVVADGGIYSLSDSQKHVFDRYVIQENNVELCTMCSQPISYCEMIGALDNGGYCSYCVHRMEKLKRE